MARIRSIKPDFWTDEKVLEVCRDSRLLFLGLLNFADDAGRMAYSPKKIKAQVFPGDEIDVAPLLAELEKACLVTIYPTSNCRVIQINGFSKHQKIDRPNKSAFPSPNSTVQFVEHSSNDRREIVEISTSDQRAITPGREGNGKGMEKEKEGEREIQKAPPLDSPDEVPEGLHQNQYAIKMLEDLGIPFSQSMVQIAASSIDTFSKQQGITKAQGYSEILARAKSAQESGETVNRFWFEDQKFKPQRVKHDKASERERALERVLAEEHNPAHGRVHERTVGG